MTASVLNLGLTANRADIRVGYGAGSGQALATVERMDSRTNNPARPLSEREAAARLGICPRTLQDWRRRACGTRSVTHWACSVAGVPVGRSPAEARENLEKAGFPGTKISNEAGTEGGACIMLRIRRWMFASWTAGRTIPCDEQTGHQATGQSCGRKELR